MHGHLTKAGTLSVLFLGLLEGSMACFHKLKNILRIKKPGLMSHKIGHQARFDMGDETAHRNKKLKRKNPNFCWISIQFEPQLRFTE